MFTDKFRFALQAFENDHGQQLQLRVECQRCGWLYSSLHLMEIANYMQLHRCGERERQFVFPVAC